VDGFPAVSLDPATIDGGTKFGSRLVGCTLEIKNTASFLCYYYNLFIVNFYLRSSNARNTTIGSCSPVRACSYDISNSALP
jgi:hypothetical protein